MSASPTASALLVPDNAGLPRMALSSSAVACALMASREPIKTRWPALAQRSARPLPSAPVPPITAIVLVYDIVVPSTAALVPPRQRNSVQISVRCFICCRNIRRESQRAPDLVMETEAVPASTGGQAPCKGERRSGQRDARGQIGHQRRHRVHRRGDAG